MKWFTLIGLVLLMIGCSGTKVTGIDSSKPTQGLYQVNYHPDSGYVLKETKPEVIVKVDTVQIPTQIKSIFSEAYANSGGCQDRLQEMVGNDWKCRPCRESEIKSFDQVCEKRLLTLGKCSSPKVTMLVCYK